MSDPSKTTLSKTTLSLFSDAILKSLSETDKQKWAKSADPDYPDYFLFNRGFLIPPMQVSLCADQKEPSKLSVWLSAQRSPFELMKFIDRKYTMSLSDLFDQAKIKMIVNGVLSLSAHQDALFAEAIAKDQLDKMRVRKVYIERYLQLFTEILTDVKTATTVESAIAIVSKKCETIYDEQETISRRMQLCSAAQRSYSKELRSYNPFPTKERREVCVEQNAILHGLWKELYLKMLSIDLLVPPTRQMCEGVKKFKALDKCINYLTNATDIVRKTQDDIVQTFTGLEKEVVLCTEKCNTFIAQ
jgi:hypothetical protein